MEILIGHKSKNVLLITYMHTYTCGIVVLKMYILFIFSLYSQNDHTCHASGKQFIQCGNSLASLQYKYLQQPKNQCLRLDIIFW